MEAVASGRIWPQLPAELSERIASFICNNYVTCTLRVVNKAAAAQFRGPEHTTVLLSQPVPPHAFAQHWGAPGATRGLSLKQRRRLLCLTAASGSIPNMEVALTAAGCLPADEVVEAAAAAGQRAMCEWLLQRGCPLGKALEAAAKAGQREVCEWLLDRGGPSNRTFSVLEAAAEGGHLGLMEWLLRTHPERFRLAPGRSDRAWLFQRAVQGCDLATLQRLNREWLEAPQGGGGEQEEEQHPVLWLYGIVASAACSPTSDWRAKVEWLEWLGYPRSEEACEDAAACPDAVERLTWLMGRGYTIGLAAFTAARTGNLAALQYLHAEGVRMEGVSFEAAQSGQLAVVAWLAEVSAGLRFTGCIMGSAAESGRLELLAGLRERGCPWGEDTFTRVAEGGSEAALEWLAQGGCPMQADGTPYLYASANDDLATLRCLARLGCPWGLLREALLHFNRAPAVLRELLAAGCPVDWDEAKAMVGAWDEGPVKAEVLALLAEERARRGGLKPGRTSGQGRIALS